jgi:hypothetical protein
LQLFHWALRQQKRVMALMIQRVTSVIRVKDLVTSKFLQLPQLAVTNWGNSHASDMYGFPVKTP